MFRRSVLIAAATCAAFALAPRARAWTDASVTRVAADIDVPRDGLATVSLAVTVHVRGGWLEQLELVGLDPGLELVAERPPVALDAEGVTHVPTAHVEPDGRILLGFVRDDAPRRGDVLLAIAYRAHLAPELDPEREPARVRWTLPPWEGGLDGASLVLHVPGHGSVPEEIACPSCELETTFDDAGTTLTLRRTHLPRATPWDIALDVPRDALALPPVMRPPPLVSRLTQSPAAWPTVLALAALLALLAVAKRAAFRRALSLRGVPLAKPSALASCARVVAAGLAAYAAVRLVFLGPLGAAAGLAVIVALALRGTPPGRGWPRAGAFVPAMRAELVVAARRPREAWLSLAALLDATTPPGAIVLALLAAGAFLIASRAAVLPSAFVPLVRALPLLAAPLFLTSTRLQLPPTAHDQLRELRRIAFDLRLPPGVALALVLHEDSHGVAQEARLRLELADPPEGLGRLDVAISVARGAGGFVMRPVCLAVVSAAGALQRSLADARLGSDAMLAPGGRRVAHVLPIAALPRLLVVFGLADAGSAPILPVQKIAAERARGARLNAIVAE